MLIKDLDSIKEFLEEKHNLYNNRSFIENDPISIPHRFSKKEDIEISGFLAATISWGNRKSILNNAGKLMELMGEEPFQFVLHHTKRDLEKLDSFVHRTFNGRDCTFFIRSLKHIYTKHKDLEEAFGSLHSNENFPLKDNLIKFRSLFLETSHLPRSEKHISNPAQKSSAKRLCMYLRWMVRKDKRKVDFGIWNKIPASQLCLPLDVHTGNISRKLGLLQRKQNDWQAVEEITSVLRIMDPADPIKYDFALFGIGIDKALN
ncbi:MAG: TIGR02757 family protein [Bacteroidia bacterium]|nr:TIGR02757 family protein [Bacteroidia bacterium]